jgi:hypothetical protein
MSTAGQPSTAEHCGENDRLEFFSGIRANDAEDPGSY